MFDEALDHFQEIAEMENHARNMGWGDDYWSFLIKID
jgi:hypothetical protein